MRQQVEFKIAVLVNDLAPRYLSEDCQLVAATSHRQLRPSDNFKCTIITTSLRLGDREFAGTRAATVKRSAHTRTSAGFDTGQFLSQTENVFLCLRHQRLVTSILGRYV